jgi:hypothetical protein
MKARKRRVLVPASGPKRPFWRKVAYTRGEKVDQLFLRNLAEYSRLVVSAGQKTGKV